MKMRNSLFLVVVVILEWTKRTDAAVLTPCALTYLTSDRSGMADTGLVAPTTCTTTNYKTVCGGFNPQCTFSLKYYYYICCYPIAATAAPLLGTSTAETIAPGSTRAPQNLKPICPSGSIGFGSNSVALTCNRTNLANAGCPTTYSCVQAVNVYDISRTPTNTMDDLGAVKTPNVCCRTITSADVFSQAGLGTSVVPVAPAANILAVSWASVAGPPVRPAADMYLGDDYSTTGFAYFSATAAAIPAGTFPGAITLYTATAAAADATRYHILIFDATTNKDCLFFGNVVGGTARADQPSPTLAIPATPAAPDNTATTANQGATVFYDVTTNPAVPVYAYGTTTLRNLIPTTNTAAHKFVVLVWQTAAGLNFGPAATTAADNTKILLGSGANGDFVPATATPAGKFTTVTAFLNLAKVKTILGTPIAGTYFYVKN